MRNIGPWNTNFFLILTTLFIVSVDAKGGKAIVLYATDNSATSDVHALELTPAEVQEVIAKYSKARILKFDSGYFTHLEGKETVFKHSSATETLTCDCKVKKNPITPKPTTKPTTPKPTPITGRSVTVEKPSSSTPAPTYLPPATSKKAPPTTRPTTTTTTKPKPIVGKTVVVQNPTSTTKPPPTYLPPTGSPSVSKTSFINSPPPKTTLPPVTPRKSTPGPPYLPIVTRETTEGPKYTYIPRTYTYGALPTYTYNFNWTYAPGTYTPNTRTYTYQPTTTTPRYARKNVVGINLN